MRALIVMLVLGRITIWAVQTSGPTKRLWSASPFLTELGECDFCIGFWVYLALGAVLGINFLEPDYFPFVSEVVTAIAVSFGVHLARIGWMMKFGTMDLTD